jgi:hypothetical protein
MQANIMGALEQNNSSALSWAFPFGHVYPSHIGHRMQCIPERKYSWVTWLFSVVEKSEKSRKTRGCLWKVCPEAGTHPSLQGDL